MCGIAGLVSSGDRPFGRAAVVATRLLRHRGPDDEGVWTDAAGRRVGADAVAENERVVLGHRRLSIVDLDTGSQPMTNEDASIWLTFNGEIYNHLELRPELESRGHRFRTTSDTEVLVHGWEEWGEGLFGRLNGIFAFALADTRRDEVVLVRDPVGVKPLYVGHGPGLVWWSSELAAARAAGLASERISHDALKLFFTFRFIPSPYTVYEAVAKLPPGHFVRIDATSPAAPRFRPYTSTIRSSAAPATTADWGEALVAELEAAVQRQLMADVPVASLLSGGVDSSLITGMMTRHLGYVPETFGIGFASAGRDSEAAAARRAADELGVAHHSTWVDESEYVQAWPEAVARMGEPVANAGGLLIDLICREVGRTHKVVLSGQGADEPLGGYSRHVVERLHPAARRFPWLSTTVTRRLAGADSAARLERALDARDRTDRYVQIFSILSDGEVDAFVPGGARPARELAREVVGQWAGEEPVEDGLNDLLRVDARMSLADDLLLIADHFSMTSSVELRVPFLDLRFLDLVERMPSRYKVSRLGKRKWLYRSAAAAHLPPPTASRLCGPRGRLARKRGFQAPLTEWFGPGGALAGRRWLEPLAGIPGLATEVAAEIGARPDDGNHARRSAALFSLATWFEASKRTPRLELREPALAGEAG